MNNLVIGVDSDIGRAIYTQLDNCSATSRRQKEYLYLDLDHDPKLTTDQIFDTVYYCIGLGGEHSPERIMQINSVLSYQCLLSVAPNIAPGGVVKVLTSRKSSLQLSLNLDQGNIYYKMSKCALNMAVVRLSKLYPSIIWMLVHPGFVDTKMTRASLDVAGAISPKQSAEAIIKLEVKQQFSFVNVDGIELEL